MAGTEKKKLYERMVTTRDLNPMWQKAVRKHVALSAVQDTDGLCIKNGEDLLMSMPMLTLAEKIVILDENLYYYRDNACSAVHKVRLSRVEAVKIVHNKMFHYIDLWALPELHGKQYARMVMSWMTLVSMVMMSGKELESVRKKMIIRSLAEDPFFTKAYREMEIDLLSKKDVIIAKWLYNKQFIWLWLAYAAKKLTS